MKKFLSVSLAIMLGVLSFSLFGCGEKLEPKLSLDKNEITMDINEVQSLTVKVENLDNPTLTWASSNDGVVEVENGVLTAVSTGTATVTVKATENVTAKCEVTVTANTIVYQNNGDVDDWGPEAENYMAVKTLSDGNKVLSIEGNSGYLPGEPENNGGEAKWKSADYDGFSVSYDVLPISSQLTGTEHTAQGHLNEGVVSLIFGLQGGTGCFAIFGAADGQGNVGLKFGCMDGNGIFDKGGQGTESNYTIVDGDVWYTVTMEFTNVEGKLKVTGKVVNKATGDVVATTNLSTQLTYSTGVEYLNGSVYHGVPETGRSLAYLDNITAIAYPKQA